MEHGYEGLGLFYTLLEKLAGQEKPIKTDILKQQLNVGKKLNKCWNFMESIGIIHSNNGETFNKQLLNFSEKYTIKKEKTAERIRQWRENQTIEENVTRSEQVRNAPKDNISKVKRSKEKLIEDREQEFLSELKNFQHTYPIELLKSFFNYWSEKSPKGKMKFEIEKTWDLNKRLIRWNDNNLKFSKNGTTKPEPPRDSRGIRTDTAAARERDELIAKMEREAKG